MSAADKQGPHSSDKVSPGASKKSDGVDNLHPDPKLAYKEQTDFDRHIKQANGVLRNTLDSWAHPTLEDSRQQVANQNKFADAYYKASAGKLIESVTGIVTGGIKYIQRQQQAAKAHDVESVVRDSNPLRPVVEFIGNIPKMAQNLNSIRPLEMLDKAKTPEGSGTLLGGIVFIASQFALPGGNKLQAANEIKGLNAAKEISNVGKLEEEARSKYAFLKTTANAEGEAAAEAKLADSAKILPPSEPAVIIRSPESPLDFKQIRFVQRECLPGFRSSPPDSGGVQLALEIPGKGIVGYAELEGSHIYAIAVLPEHRGEATKMLFKAITDHCRNQGGWFSAEARRDTAFRFLQAQAKRGNIEMQTVYEGKAPDGHIYHRVNFRFTDKASKANK